MISGTPEVRFDLLVRGDGGQRRIASFVHPYSEQATQYEDSRSSTVTASAGDRLVLIVSVAAANPSDVFIPHGEEPSSPTARLLTIDTP